MRNSRLNELQAEIKIGRRNINNLRYEDQSTLMAESKEALKSLLMRVKEESKRDSLRLNIKKKKNKKLTSGMRPYTTPYSNFPLNIDQNVEHS